MLRLDLRVIVLVLTLCACAQPPRPLLSSVSSVDADWEVRMLRSICLGATTVGGCPEYAVVVRGDGRVEYYGGYNVATTGMQSLTVEANDLAELSRTIDRTHFFAIDEASLTTSCKPAAGQPHQNATGAIVVPTVTCVWSTCVDTPHAIIRVRRGARVHQVEDDHCVLSPDLIELEHVIDRVAGVAGLVRRPIPDQ
jgi:hypothetical protein